MGFFKRVLLFSSEKKKKDALRRKIVAKAINEFDQLWGAKIT